MPFRDLSTRRPAPSDSRSSWKLSATSQPPRKNSDGDHGEVFTRRWVVDTRPRSRRLHAGSRPRSTHRARTRMRLRGVPRADGRAPPDVRAPAWARPDDGDRRDPCLRPAREQRCHTAASQSSRRSRSGGSMDPRQPASRPCGSSTATSCSTSAGSHSRLRRWQPPVHSARGGPPRRSDCVSTRVPTMGGRADVYVGFYEHGLLALRPGCALGFICADRWMRNAYGGRLREMVTGGWSVDAIVSMTGVDAFEDEVDAYPAVTVLRRRRSAGVHWSSRSAGRVRRVGELGVVRFAVTDETGQHVERTRIRAARLHGGSKVAQAGRTARPTSWRSRRSEGQVPVL